MRFLPFDKFEFLVDESLCEVNELLLTHTIPSGLIGMLFASAGKEQFKGFVNKDSFCIRRNVFQRNSFLPILFGKVEQNTNRTRIKVIMTLHPITVMLIIVLIPFLISCFSDNLISTIIIISLSIVMIYSGFWMNVKKTKHLFKEIFSQGMGVKS